MPTRSDSLLAPSEYDADAASIRSAQDSDSDDDQLQQRARNSRELRAHDSLVLVQEEDTDRLITDARSSLRIKRRGSGMPIPNPINLLRRTTSGSPSVSRSRSRSAAPGDGAIPPPVRQEQYVKEEEERTRRSRRRSRRKERKDRLLGEAQHGEDRGLMYEMEQGGLKEGSSTGESTDSDEIDKQNEKKHRDPLSRPRRRWGIWLLIYLIMGVFFAALVLIAWKLSVATRTGIDAKALVSNGTALFAPTTIIISLDGFRADFLQRGLTPRLNAFVKEGVSPLYMTPSFPSVTFPNHYTLATGLYPESHGVVGNTFWDPALQEEFYYTDPARSMDPKWWLGEPFWVTAETQGIRSAIHMWPGSEAHIMGVEPSFLDKYDGAEKLHNKVDRILEFLDKPGLEDSSARVAEMRPQIIAAYVPNVDSDGHKYGPNSTEIRDTIKKADDMMDSIFQGLEERNLTHIVNVIVVSDHGMATTDVDRMIQIDDLVDVDKIAHTDGWPLVGLRPKNPDELEEIYQGLLEKVKSYPALSVYRRDLDMPERYHFSQNDRIAPIWIIPETGWAIVKKSDFDIAAAKVNGDVYHPRGLHGYDHEHPLMRAIFIARGPAFPHAPNSRLDSFRKFLD
jgi:predicted AlkP superfamily pyrophosphatase or phosphodiesterase